MPKLTDMLAETLQHAAAIALLACPAAACAQAPDAPPKAPDEPILKVGYQIPRESAARPELVGPRNGAAPTARPVAALMDSAIPAASRKFEPQWAHEMGTRGPAVELGALGAGRPDTPSLVHFAFSWNF